MYEAKRSSIARKTPLPCMAPRCGKNGISNVQRVQSALVIQITGETSRKFILRKRLPSALSRCTRLHNRRRAMISGDWYLTIIIPMLVVVVVISQVRSLDECCHLSLTVCPRGLGFLLRRRIYVDNVTNFHVCPR